MSGSTALELARPAPRDPLTGAPVVGLSDKIWSDLLGLEALTTSALATFPSHFTSQLSQWQTIFSSDDPASVVTTLTQDLNLSAFQQLLILRCVRQDTVIPNIMTFVASLMGRRFIEPGTEGSDVGVTVCDETLESFSMCHCVNEKVF